MTYNSLGTGALVAVTTTPAQTAARTSGSIGLWLHAPAANAVNVVVAQATGTGIADRLLELAPGQSIGIGLASGIRPYVYTLSGTANLSVREVF